MISVTTGELNALLGTLLWPLARILALIASAPVLGNPSVPTRVKIGLSLAITVAVAPGVDSTPGTEPASYAGLLILAQQVAIGLAMGLAMRIVFVAVEMAGELAGLQMGLGFATFFDPQHSGQIPILGQFLGLLAALAFLAMDGHLQLIAVLSESFRTFPVGTSLAGASYPAILVSWGAEIFAMGLRLALPVLATLLITNLAFGILTRMVPQLNLFAVGFPLTLLIGILALALAIPRFAPLFDGAVHDALMRAALIAR